MLQSALEHIALSCVSNPHKANLRSRYWSIFKGRRHGMRLCANFADRLVESGSVRLKVVLRKDSGEAVELQV